MRSDTILFLLSVSLRYRGVFVLAVSMFLSPLVFCILQNFVALVARGDITLVHCLVCAVLFG